MSRLRLIRVLNLRQLRRQPGRAVLAVLAMAAGTAIVVATGHLVSSLERSITDVLRSISGPAPLSIVGVVQPAGVDAALTEKVQRTPGVEAAVPTVLAVAIAEKPNGDEVHFLGFGVDCRIEALVGAFECNAQTLGDHGRDGPVLMSSVLDRELGSDATLRTNAGRIPLRDAPVNDTLDDTNGGRMAVFTLPTAQRLFGASDRLDAIYVQPEPGVDVEQLRTRLEKVVGGWNAVIKRGELPPYLGMGGPLGPLLIFASLLALGLSGMLVYNIVALSLAERRRDLAVAGAVGAASSALTQGILVEAAVLGIAGGVLGALGGLALAPLLVDTISSVLVEQSVGMRATTHLSWPTVITGVAMGGVTGIVAAYFPARRTRRLDLAAELHGRAPQLEDAPRRAGLRLVVLTALGGLSVLAAYIAQRGGALEEWQSNLASIAMVAAGATLLAAVGAAAPMLLRVVLRPLRATGGPLRVAVSNLVGRPRRTTVLAASVGAAVALACVLGSVIPAIKGAVGGDTRPTGNAAGDRVFISTLPMNNAGGNARPSPKLLRAIERLPGVAEITPNRCVALGDSAAARGAGTGLGVCTQPGRQVLWDEGNTPFPRVAGDVTLSALDRGEAIVGTSAARAYGLRPGSTLALATPTRIANVRIAGIWRSSNDNGYRVTLSERRFVELYGPVQAENLWVTPDPGVSAATLARRIEEANLDPDLYALTPREASLKLADEVGEQVTPFWMLQRLLLFVALIATLSTLLLVGVQRRREFGVLGAVGFGPASLGRLTLTEALVGGAAGAFLGWIASFGLFETLRNVSAVAIGASPPFKFDARSALLSTALALVIVAIGGVIPAWRASRLQIVEAIRDE